MGIMCSERKKCLTAGQRPRFLDIYQNTRLSDYSPAYEKSTPKGALKTKNHRITREELRQKAKEVLRGILAVFVLLCSGISDINF